MESIQDFYSSLNQPKAVRLIKANRVAVQNLWKQGCGISEIKTYADLRKYSAFKCEMLAQRFEKYPEQWRHIATYSQLYKELMGIQEGDPRKIYELAKKYNGCSDGGDIWDVMDFVEYMTGRDWDSV